MHSIQRFEISKSVSSHKNETNWKMSAMHLLLGFFYYHFSLLYSLLSVFLSVSLSEFQQRNIQIGLLHHSIWFWCLFWIASNGIFNNFNCFGWPFNWLNVAFNRFMHLNWNHLGNWVTAIMQLFYGNIDPVSR